MFHVSIASLAYKYWLNAALNYLFNQYEVDSRNYIKFLEHIAKSFVFDRYLANEPLDYYEMIYKNLSPVKREESQLNLEKLRFRQIENKLVFNFLDYLLWSKYKDKEADQSVKSFEYSFRSSVEHYYPQTPINTAVEKIDGKYLHSFGNLCLISHDKNSRLSNFSPVGKKDYYSKDTKIDSVKQFMMMKYASWSIKQIEQHYSEMLDLLKSNMNSDFELKQEVSLASKWFNEYKVSNRELLIRAMLCFGDCTRHISGDKYNLFDFDHIKQHEAFRQYEEYIESNNPGGLKEIIDDHVKRKSFQRDWRYLFVKYPQVTEYCKEGCFLWYENKEARLVYLLESVKRTEYKSKELYSFLLRSIFLNKHSIDCYCDWDTIYIRIGFDNEEGYYLTNESDDAVLELCIWNEEGESIDYLLKPLVNGDSIAVKQLAEFKWTKGDDGNFGRFGKRKLLTLVDDAYENIFNLELEVIRLLKNGFGIKL